ncbi:hypothetical protein BH09ACT12_BH09ACT12_14990 [soil metagenome]
MTFEDDPPAHQDFRRGMAWALVSAIVVLACAWAAYDHQQGLVDNSAQEAIDARADTIEAATEAEISRFLGVVTFVADALSSGGDITEDAFRGLTAGARGLDLDGATSIVYVAPPVATSALRAAQRGWRRTFSPDLELTPNPDADEHAFALVSTSLDGVADRPGGVDLSSAPAPYAALMEARRSGSAAVSDAYQLIIDQQLPADGRQTSFSLVMPVENDGVFLGWVLMGLRGQDFLGHVLGIAGEGTLDTVLSASDASGAETRVASVGEQRDGATLERTRLVPVAQQAWTLEVRTDLRSLIGPSRLMPRNTLIAGIGVALLVGLLVYVTVTGRTRSEQKVRLATAELAAANVTSRRQTSVLDTILETIEEVGVTVVDPEGRFVVQSRAARQMLGIDGEDGPVEDPEGPDTWQTNFGIYHLDGTAMETAELPLARAMTGEVTDAIPLMIRNDARPEGAQLEVSGRPLSFGDGTFGALAVFRDVTQERRQQAELVGFAGVVAHDLRHPLTVIGGYIAMALDDCLPGLDGDPQLLKETKICLTKAMDGATRMGDLISDLLEYTTARDSELNWRRVDLKAIAREVAATYDHPGVATDGTAPHIHLGDLPVVDGDPDRLRQLFTNLIGNAVKYVVPGEVPLLDVSATERQGRVRLRFADRGIGIPPDKVSEVFRPFMRAHKGNIEGASYAGTGLGLAICHQVVRRHGGEISVKPHRGGGSVFSIDLPLVRSSGSDAADQAAASGAAESGVKPDLGDVYDRVAGVDDRRLGASDDEAGAVGVDEAHAPAE